MGKPIPEAVLDRACAAYAAIADDCMGLVRRKAMQAALTAAQQQGQAVAWNVLRIGNYGAAYDPRGACRAFTYDHQPGNVDAGRLGAATVTAANAGAGDSIDRGLALLKALQEEGFGVFQIGAAQPMQQGGGEAAMEAWHAAVNDAGELRSNAPDERYARRAANVESWIKANRPAPPSAPLGGGKKWPDDYCPECGSNEVSHREDNHIQCGACGQEYFTDIDYSDVVRENLKRLFALAQQPAPSATVGVEEQPVAWTDADMEKPCGAEVAFLRRLSEAQWVPAEVGGMLRHSARLLEHRATALRSIYDLLNVETGADAGAEIARLHALTQQPAACDGTCYRSPSGLCETHEAEAAVAQQPAAVDGAMDTRCMDWLERHAVEVRTPMRYGSAALFHAEQVSDDDEPYRTNLRAQVAAALATQPGGSDNV